MKQLTRHTEKGGNRGYDSVEERDEDIKRLKEQGYNHFVTYRDSNASIALSYGIAHYPMNPIEIKRPWTPKPGDRAYDLLR